MIDFFEKGIIRFSGPFYCFRTSKSLLWPLKWNSKLLFLIVPPVFRDQLLRNSITFLLFIITTPRLTTLLLLAINFWPHF